MTFAPTAPWSMCTVHTVLAPSDRTVIAACEQVGCVRYRQGWTATYDEGTPEGRQCAAMVRSGRHGRSFRELPRTGGSLVAFRFDAHQRCFTEHRTRAEVFVVTNEAGRERGARRVEPRPVFWAESLHETQDRRQTAKQRG